MVALFVSLALHLIAVSSLPVGQRVENVSQIANSPRVIDARLQRDGGRDPLIGGAQESRRQGVPEPQDAAAVRGDAKTVDSLPPSVAVLPILPDFLPPSMLDQLPRAIAVGALVPPDHNDPTVGGTLRIKLWIDAEGAVVSATIVDAGGLPESYQEAARSAFLRSKFTPARRGGAAVPSSVSIVVEYEALAAQGGM